MIDHAGQGPWTAALATALVSGATLSVSQEELEQIFGGEKIPRLLPRLLPPRRREADGR